MCYAFAYKSLADDLAVNTLPEVSGANYNRTKRLDTLRKICQNYSKAANLAEKANLSYSKIGYDKQSSKAKSFQLLCQAEMNWYLAKIEHTAQAWKNATDSYQTCYDCYLASGNKNMYKQCKQKLKYARSMYKNLSRQ